MGLAQIDISTVAEKIVRILSYKDHSDLVVGDDYICCRDIINEISNSFDITNKNSRKALEKIFDYLCINNIIELVNLLYYKDEDIPVSLFEKLGKNTMTIGCKSILEELQENGVIDIQNNLIHPGEFLKEFIVCIEIIKNCISKSKVSGSCYIRAITKFENYSEKLLTWGILAKQNQKYHLALELFNLSLHANPDNKITWAEVGDTERILANYDLALVSFDKVIELDPHNTVGWVTKGHILGQLGLIDQALLYFDKAIEINPNEESALQNKGMALRMLGRYTEALPFYYRSIEINSNNVNSWVDISAIFLILYERYHMQDLLKEAIYSLDVAITIEPSNSKILINKGIALGFNNDYQEAIKCFDKAIELDPKDPNPWYNKGNFLDDVGEYLEAIKCFDKAIELDPKDPHVWNNIGVSFFNLKEYDRAIVCFNRSIELDPENSNSPTNKQKLYYYTGLAYHNSKKFTKAIEYYDKVLSNNSRDKKTIMIRDRAIKAQESSIDVIYDKDPQPILVYAS